MWDILTLIPFYVLFIKSSSRKLLVSVLFIKTLRLLPYTQLVDSLKTLFPHNLRLITMVETIFSIFMLMNFSLLVGFLSQCEAEVVPEVSEYIPKCTNMEFHRSARDELVMTQTFDTSAKVAWEDHMAFFMEYSGLCEISNITHNKYCRNWARSFQRIFYISRKYPELGEDVQAIYMKLNVVFLKEYYVFALYWTSQFVSRNFISTYSMLDSGETWERLIFVFFTYLIYSAILARNVAVFIDYDPAEAELFLKIVAQNNCFKNAVDRHLLRASHKKLLQNSAREYEEMSFAAKNSLLEREFASMPAAATMNLKYKAAEETFINMNLHERLGMVELKLLASVLKVYTIPRNGFVLRSHDLVSGIIIIRDGIFTIKPDMHGMEKKHDTRKQSKVTDMFEAEDVNANYEGVGDLDGKNSGMQNDQAFLEQEYENISVHTNLNRFFPPGADNDIFVRSDQLKPGDCIGISSLSKGYDFWICSLRAHVPSTVYVLDWADIQETTKKHGRHFQKVMNVLYEYVENTIYKVDHCFTQFDLLQENEKMRTQVDDVGKKSGRTSYLKTKLHSYKNQRIIFHPCENGVNIFFIVTSAFKLLNISYLCLFVCFLALVERDEDEDDVISDSYFFASVIALNLVTVSEMIFRLHVGFLHKKSGKVIIYPILVWENYLKKKYNLLLDLLSLMPLWIIHHWFREFFDVKERAEYQWFWLSMAKRITQLVPICNLFIQAHRAMSFYNIASQARPYNHTVSKIKYISKAVIQAWNVIWICASLWIVVGCPKGPLSLKRCDINGWVYVDWNVKKTMTTTFQIVLHSCSFVTNLLARGSYEDIGVYNRYEMIFVTLFNTLIVLVNTKIQAGVVTAIYAFVAKERARDDDAALLAANMDRHKLDTKTKNKVSGYVKIHDALDQTNSFQKVFAELHPSLRQDCHYALTSHFLSLIKATAPLPVGVRRYLATHVAQELFIEGDQIFSNRNVIDCFYYITSGEVTVTMGRLSGFNRTTKRLGPHMLINPSAEVGLELADWSCKAKVNTTLFCLDMSIIASVVLRLLEMHRAKEPKFKKSAEEYNHEIRRKREHEKREIRRTNRVRISEKWGNHAINALIKRSRDRNSIGSAFSMVEEGEKGETVEGKRKSKPTKQFTAMSTSAEQHDKLTQQIADNIDSLTERRLLAVEMWEKMQEQVRPSLRHFGRQQTSRRIAWAAIEEHLHGGTEDMGQVLALTNIHAATNISGQNIIALAEREYDIRNKRRDADTSWFVSTQDIIQSHRSKRVEDDKGLPFP